jgi:uncharacterized protein YdhG (YjbR/CyaY superfamily)
MPQHSRSKTAPGKPAKRIAAKSKRSAPRNAASSSAAKRKPSTIDAYLQGVSDAQRAALEVVRRTIRAAAPSAEECISYGLAAFRLDGKVLVGFGATARGCAFYPMSGSTIAAHRKQLTAFKTSKGSIHFSADAPLKPALIRTLTRARIAENRRRG